ncbi:hypothetical protein DNU06_01395 [Putridiphycobacter roseus]|uniref:DUF7793 domain-containing protein n=1 Tax=Putridiphycobacter roseus TaxID=2219161 RepID=A0A2W1NG91_9FLAO|nr:hypothetical protein [Putridiphycobacter roseus]PZE18515.1 hypothetical protein DNU06_01395 [Putridiphycobacter roseus]
MTDNLKIELSFSHVSEIETGITYVRFKNDQEVDLAAAKTLNAARQKINGTKPFYSLVNMAAVYGSVSKEAQTYWARECETAKQIKFEAIIVNSLPVRIIAKNYIKQFKPLFKIQLFKNKELALAAIHKEMKKDS